MNNESALVAHQPAQLGLGDFNSFAHMERIAKTFSESQLVPEAFRRNLPNCLVALDMALRMRANPLMVMQNLSIIHGKPSFSAQFMIASINASGNFSPLRFHWVGTQGQDDWGCYAQATAKIDNALCKGTTITWAIAKKEGWVSRNGSKWGSMPELMFQYRAATWWCRMFSPELLMGFPTEDEVIDVNGIPTVVEAPQPAPTPPSSRRRSEKGVAGARNVTPESTPPPAGSDPVTDANAPKTPPPQPETGTEKKPDEPPAANTKPADTTEEGLFEPPAEEPNAVRCEITHAEEKQQKRQSGALAPMVHATLKGDYTGKAYWDGELAKFPGDSSIIDVVLIDKQHGDKTLKIIKSWKVAS